MSEVGLDGKASRRHLFMLRPVEKDVAVIFAKRRSSIAPPASPCTHTAAP